jgi:alkaline phosphatase D
MTGDVSDTRAILWSRTDRPARLVLEYSLGEAMKTPHRIMGPAALAETDYTARVELYDLWPGERVFYRASFIDLADGQSASAPLTGSFRAAPGGRDTITFAFSGDEAGQGWGINPDLGGYKLYESMRQARPDFFIHSGDQIYADGPIVPEVRLEDGRSWRNLVTPEKSKVAESVAEFRAAFAYNLLDENKRRFAAEVPFLVQWDDHETRNNWYPGQTIGDDRYKVGSTSLLSAFARKAMFEYNPIRFDPMDPERVYRAFSFGPLLDVLMLDERSYRGPNSSNRQTTLESDAAFLGPAQMRWLKQRLLASKATWKLIASDMPLSLVVPDLNPDVRKGTFEAWANGDDGPPSGRELEIANLLSFIKGNQIRNVVWVTADVHYAAAHYYRPSKANFTEFEPFWEFVAGPINAGTFGPNALDMTFGPEERFLSIPRDLQQNRSPLDGYQFFGLGRIDPYGVLTVSLHGINGQQLWKVDLEPVA